MSNKRVKLIIELADPDGEGSTSFGTDMCGILLWGANALHEAMCVISHEQNQGIHGGHTKRFNDALHWLRDNLINIEPEYDVEDVEPDNER